MVDYSPLRYPGGKSCFVSFFSEFIYLNNINECIYSEPFAGGAGAALGLLFSGKVSKIILNDLDIFIYNFWDSILSTPEELIKKIYDTPVNLEEWRKQRAIFKSKNLASYSNLDIGFATFYLNRCNRSGILYAGPIGGQKQDGIWKIDARFNKKNLIKRIEKIVELKKNIEVYGVDAIDFIKKIQKKYQNKEKVFFYIDPPYFEKGKKLYKNFCNVEYHKKFSQFITKIKKCKWILTYDDNIEIRNLYKNEIKSISINYSIDKPKKGKEIFITQSESILPSLNLFT